MFRLIQYPAAPCKGRITVTKEDLACLKSGEFLNDVIIDFYLKSVKQSRTWKLDISEIWFGLIHFSCEMNSHGSLVTGFTSRLTISTFNITFQLAVCSCSSSQSPRCPDSPPPPAAGISSWRESEALWPSGVTFSAASSTNSWADGELPGRMTPPLSRKSF